MCSGGGGGGDSNIYVKGGVFKVWKETGTGRFSLRSCMVTQIGGRDWERSARAVSPGDFSNYEVSRSVLEWKHKEWWMGGSLQECIGE